VGGLLLVTDYEGTTTYHWPAYDGNGNVAALVAQADGSLSARYEYGPFGEAIRATGVMGKKNPIRFSTKYTDDQTGLLYYGYRYYNPTTGRWISRDPIEERGGRRVPDLYRTVLRSGGTQSQNSD
jgi:RHS repeat-associated protein